MMLISEQMLFLEYIDKIHYEYSQSKSATQSFIFVTGEAGTGKSYLLMTVVDMLEEIDPQSTIVVAYTGYAALNVKGCTIHSGLKIQIDRPKSNEDDTDDTEMKKAALETLANLSEKLKNLKWLIIDEISLVSESFFDVIDERLRQIKNRPDKPFGNVNVLIFGDLLQLPPVSAKPVFFNNLWKQFQMYELKYIHRQENDLVYAQLCNRARIGKLTEGDYNLLMTRHRDVLTQEEIDSFSEAIHVVLLKEEAKELNEMKQATFKNFKIFASIDCMSDGSEIEKVPKRLDIDVPSELKIAIGSKVMLKVNLNAENGLVNGLIGTVLDFNENSIQVKFDEDKVHSISRHKFRSRIAPKKYYVRRQFPLIHSWAINVHKVQGITLEKAIISLSRDTEEFIDSDLIPERNIGSLKRKQRLFCTGLVYTVLSRVSSLKGLLVYKLDRDIMLKPNYSKAALDEYSKIKKLKV
ncbi:uncharacterized protein B4U80_13271 [Leptotrombidium deliense]|uniref:ATP-dependent DNA helicase n=1 Tax=Leptotrombidium deliense TaxID=299467 RepID=A0A443S9E9_9ACAR|nr:uncharacterized protein B4U80_13271 [Leptotrombidium deliense]